MELPINQFEFSESVVAALGVEPVMSFAEGGDVPVQRRDRDGRLLWTVSVAYRGRGDRRPEVIQVRLVADLEPVVVAGPIWFTGVSVRTWEMGDRRGVSFSAQTFTQAEPPSVRRAKEAAAV